MNNPAAANRVATTIATFKWVIIGLIVFAGVVAFIGAASQGGSEALVGFLFLIGAALYALIFYVIWGFFEHVLRMLADIQINTGILAGTVARPSAGPPAPPAPPYNS